MLLPSFIWRQKSVLSSNAPNWELLVAERKNTFKRIVSRIFNPWFFRYTSLTRSLSHTLKNNSFANSSEFAQIFVLKIANVTTESWVMIQRYRWTAESWLTAVIGTAQWKLCGALSMSPQSRRNSIFSLWLSNLLTPHSQSWRYCPAKTKVGRNW